ncbi:MAG: ATP-binding cassette domain-containing protein [Pseudomonadota bacterium]
MTTLFGMMAKLSVAHLELRMITFSNVALRRGAQLLFDRASFTVHAGERIGLVGRNGSGKSSLFAAIEAQLPADVGDIGLPDQATITSIAQHLPTHSRTALDYTIDGDERLRAAERELQDAEAQGANGERLATLHARVDDAGGYTAQARASRILAGLGFSTQDLERNIQAFSGGWRMRLSLAHALMSPSDVLLLDEPTNHLDFEAIVWLERWLSRYPGTLLLISHDREFLDATVSRVINIRGQKIEEYRGNYSDFERALAERISQESALRARQDAERARIQRFVDRFRAKATKARQAQSRVKMLERMETVAVTHIDAPFRFSFPAPGRMPNPLLTVEKAAVGYDDADVLSGIDAALTPGARIGVVGVNGAGKSTLIKLIKGDLAPRRGRRVVHPGLRIGYFAQHQLDQLDVEASPRVMLSRLAPDAPEQRLRDYLGGFGFGAARYETPCGTFSGGEKSRLILACLIWSEPNLLLLDEPTNHLDMDMRAALTLALQEFEGALMLIAHDRHLIRSTTDEIWLIANGQVNSYEGDVSDYQALHADHPGQETAADRSGANATANRARKRVDKRTAAEYRKQKQPLQTQAREIERTLERHQADIHRIDERIANNEVPSADMPTVLKERANLAQIIESTESRWLETQEAIEAIERKLKPPE